MICSCMGSKYTVSIWANAVQHGGSCRNELQDHTQSSMQQAHVTDLTAALRIPVQAVWGVRDEGG